MPPGCGCFHVKAAPCLLALSPPYCQPEVWGQLGGRRRGANWESVPVAQIAAHGHVSLRPHVLEGTRPGVPLEADSGM